MSREGMSINLDVNVRKISGDNHHIRGGEFQRVGTTIFLKSKFQPGFSEFGLFLPSYNPFKVILNFMTNWCLS